MSVGGFGDSADYKRTPTKPRRSRSRPSDRSRNGARMTQPSHGGRSRAWYSASVVVLRRSGPDAHGWREPLSFRRVARGSVRASGRGLMSEPDTPSHTNEVLSPGATRPPTPQVRNGSVRDRNARIRPSANRAVASEYRIGWCWISGVDDDILGDYRRVSADRHHNAPGDARFSWADEPSRRHR